MAGAEGCAEDHEALGVRVAIGLADPVDEEEAA